MIPARNTPSKVPAPPILTTGAPILEIPRRLSKSAPIKVPRVPPVYAIMKMKSGFTENIDFIRMELSAATIGGTNAGVTMPTPFTGRATILVTKDTIRIP